MVNSHQLTVNSLKAPTLGVFIDYHLTKYALLPEV